MITLAFGVVSLELPSDLLWSDQHNWQPVEQTASRSLTGNLLIDVATKTGGRPITLQPEDDRCAWMLRSTLDAVRAWAVVAGRQMTLTINGTAYTVVFRHQDGAISAAPVVHFNSQSSGDFWLVTLRFMEI